MDNALEFLPKETSVFYCQKKDIHIYWLIVAIIYHSSSVGNTRGALISCGEAGGGGGGGRGKVWYRKTTET